MDVLLSPTEPKNSFFYFRSSPRIKPKKKKQNLPDHVRMVSVFWPISTTMQFLQPFSNFFQNKISFRKVFSPLNQSPNRSNSKDEFNWTPFPTQSIAHRPPPGWLSFGPNLICMPNLIFSCSLSLSCFPLNHLVGLMWLLLLIFRQNSIPSFPCWMKKKPH